MRKLAFMRSSEGGNPMWNGHCRYHIPGVSPSHSVYDVADGLARDDFGWDEQIKGGVIARRTRQRLTNPTLTRQTRIGAQFSSLAAQHIFQGGWVTNWDHLIPGSRPNLGEGRTLTMNFNPNAPGTKEGQRATVYNPWPSAAALYPKAI